MSSGITVLIRTFNSAGTLPDVLDRLKLGPDDELLVVDSGSTDATLQVSREYRARVVMAERPFNYSRSLNLGFQAASRQWVLVMSSHCIPLVPDLLSAFRAALRTFSSNVAVAYGVCSIVKHPAPADETVFFASQDSRPPEQRNIFGGNALALYRRDWWEKLAFDEAVPTGEDLVWFARALAKGGVAARVPAARVLGRNQGSLRYMFRKGVLESWMEREVSGVPNASLLQFGIRLGALLKKCALGRIPFGVLLRQGALALGAFLSPVLVSPQQRQMVKEGLNGGSRDGA